MFTIKKARDRQYLAFVVENGEARTLDDKTSSVQKKKARDSPGTIDGQLDQSKISHNIQRGKRLL